MKPDEKIKNLLEKLPKLTLSEKEKAQMRSYLINFMKMDFVKNAPLASYQNKDQSHWNPVGIIKLINKKPVLKYVFSSLIMVLFLGSATSFGAQKSLPGDLLYSVKTRINEKVLSWLATSDEAKARYDINLVQLRLEEAEKVASKNKLDDTTSQKVKTLLNEHIEDMKNRIENIKSKEQLTTTIETNSELEASLNAHAEVISELADREHDNATAINTILSEIKDRSDQTAKSRQLGESKLSLKDSSDIKADADSKLDAVNHTIEEVEKFVDDKKIDILPSAYQKAETDLTVAQDTMIEGKAKLDAKDYHGAFIAFQDAKRKVQEIQIYVLNESRLKGELIVPEIKMRGDDRNNNSGVIEIGGVGDEKPNKK